MHFTDESKINENLCHEHVASLPYAYMRERETKSREREKERKNLPVGRIVKVMERNKSGEEHMAAFLSLFSWAFALARDLAFNSSTVKHVFPILQNHASLLPAYFYPF